MSRVAKQPVPLPQGVTATITDELVTVKGAKGSLNVALTGGVKVVQAEKQLELRRSGARASRQRRDRREQGL